MAAETIAGLLTVIVSVHVASALRLFWPFFSWNITALC